MSPGIPSPPTLLLLIIERLIGNLLRFDPSLRDSVAVMAGKVIAIELRGLDRVVYALPEREALHLAMEYEGDIHLRLRGTPLALASLAMAQDKRIAAFSGEVEILGDLGLSRHLQACLGSLNIDWEELLSYYVGDIPAHQLGRVYRSCSSWLGEARETLELDIAEYLKTEIALLPEREEVRAFLEAVDVLRADTDRLEARVKRLERHLARGC
jgi:ubiquinone biosynthesis accessory factor UbiJ